jgi:uncharacterized membrane protein YhhN
MLLRKPTIAYRAGLVCFLLSNLVGYFAPRTHLASQAWIDGIHGALLGASIGLLLLGLRGKALLR